VSHRFVLDPQKAGDFVITPQEITYKGERYTTEPVQLKVTPSSTPSQRQETDDRSESGTSGRSSDGKGDFFIEAFVDKDTAYVNEQVTLTFRFYQGKRLHSNPEYKPPTTTGFWVEDLPPQKNFNKTIRGQLYQVAEIKTALFPTAPGLKTVGAASLNIKQEDLFSIFDRDPFGFFDRRRQRSTEPVYLETEPIDVTVLPLPNEGKPADFSGSVGQFKLSSNIDRTLVEVNQPVTVTIKLSGRGNIKTLPEPQAPEIDNFRMFSSGKSENVSKAGYVVGGSKTFELTYVPKEPGIYTIPAVKSNYFDPSEGKYKTISGKAYEITVTGISNEEIAAQNGVPSGRLDLVAKDIRYIITDVSGTDSGGGLYFRSPLYLLLNLVPLAALVAVFSVRRRKDKLADDVGYRRLRRAVKMAKGRLAEAEMHMKSSKSKEFYAEISRALSEYIGDKFNVSAQGLTMQQVEDLFVNAEAPDDLRREYAELIDSCDMGRFATSSHDTGEMSGVLKSAEEWIVRFEDSIR
jgi:hypothetical protein